MLCHLCSLVFPYVFHLVSSRVVYPEQIKAHVLLTPRKRREYFSSSLLLKETFPVYSSQGIAFVALAGGISLLSLLHIIYLEMLSDAFSKIQKAEHSKASLLKNMILLRHGNCSMWLLLMQRSLPNILLWLYDPLLVIFSTFCFSFLFLFSFLPLFPLFLLDLNFHLLIFLFTHYTLMPFCVFSRRCMTCLSLLSV